MLFGCEEIHSFSLVIQSDTSQSRGFVSSCMQNKAGRASQPHSSTGINLVAIAAIALILYVKAYVSPSNSVADIHSLRSWVMLLTSKPDTSSAFMGHNCLFCLQRCISIQLERHICGKPQTNGKLKNVMFQQIKKDE